MRIIDRYITREFLKTYLIIFISFAVLFIVVDVIDNLPKLVRNGATTQQATLYYLLRLPYLLVLTSPVTVLLTGLFMMNGLSKHNESVAIRAAGISIKRAMLPLFAIGFLISIGIAVIGEYLLPYAEKTRSFVYNVQIKGEDPEDQMLKARIHYRGQNNDFYYFGFFDGYKNTIRIIDLTVIDFKTKHIVQHMTASSAVWQKDHWVLQDVELRKYQDGKQVSWKMMPATEEKFLDVQPKDFIRITKKTLSLNFWELKDYIRRLQKLGEKTNREVVDLHMKLAFPLTNLIIIFFFIPIATTNVRSKGRGWVFMLGLLVCFSFLIVVRIIQSLGYNGVIPPVIAAWSPDVFFALLGLVFLKKAEI
ncbi:MAG TPA: LPS export ABC transporter permease LptG [Candidatus Cloacimonadota bacterium]|nr:LPS export ABC transporter permease LptG [Candidatus Cloacimonadota bacterium]HPS37980.1 LPS export ABC transporter permease LptG [Candidatus Cloacimonadota bacterium]